MKKSVLSDHKIRSLHFTFGAEFNYAISGRGRGARACGKLQEPRRRSATTQKLYPLHVVRFDSLSSNVNYNHISSVCKQVVINLYVAKMVIRRKIDLEQGCLPNTGQYTINTARGAYVVQVAWPLCWTSDRLPPPDTSEAPVSSLYVSRLIALEARTYASSVT